jgi:hypothetical protein
MRKILTQLAVGSFVAAAVLAPAAAQAAPTASTPTSATTAVPSHDCSLWDYLTGAEGCY